MTQSEYGVLAVFGLALLLMFPDSPLPVIALLALNASCLFNRNCRSLVRFP